MIIAQKTYKHKVLLLMKVGLAVFMVVIFLAQNAQSGVYEAGNYAYKRLNANETQYFLNSLNILSDGTEDGSGLAHGLNLELLSAQISEHIRTAVEPLLLQEASVISTNSPLFTAHKGNSNLLMCSFIFGIIALLLITNQNLIFKYTESLKLENVLASISPRAPNLHN